MKTKTISIESFVTGVTLLLVATVMTIAGPGEVRAADSPSGGVISLSNEHVGMTGDEIQAEQQVAQVDTAAAGAASGADPLASQAADAQARADAAAKALADAEAALAAAEAAEAGEVPPSEFRTEPSELDCPAPSAVTATFESCVEASIRAGNAFGESHRVCRAAFPEPEPEPAEPSTTTP